MSALSIMKRVGMPSSPVALCELHFMYMLLANWSKGKIPH